MAITAIAGTAYEATGSVSSATVTLPTGLAAGDVTFLFCTLNASNGAIAEPTGWLTAFPSQQSAASTSHSVAVYYKPWVSGDANPTVTCTSGRLAVLPVRVSGADASTPLAAAVASTSQTAATTSVDAPSATSTSGTLLLTAHSGRSASNGVFIAWTPPSGMTEVGEAGGKATTQTNASIEVCSLTVTAGAATGVRTATADSTATGSRGLTMLLAPAAAVTTTVTATRGTSWRTLARVSGTRSTSWAVAALQSTTYGGYAEGYVTPLTGSGGYYGGYGEGYGGITVTRSTAWNVRTQVSVSRATTWNVALQAGTVAAARSTLWTVRAGVTATSGTSWAVRATVTASRASSWSVLARVTSIRSVLWATLATGTPTSTPGMRLRVYAPNGADLGPLPTPEGVSVAYPLDDVGGLTFTYSPRAPRADLLGQPCEIAVEVSPDNGITWAEPANSRFVYLTDARDPLDRNDKFGVEAKSYIWRFSKARVLPNGLLNNDGKRAFLSATPGVILKTLLNEATARGALTGISHSSFTTALDSAGAAWGSTLTIYYEPGLDYLALLMNLADQGFVDFRMQGRALYVYNANATMARDLTVGGSQVIFRAGRDLTEAPFRRTWENLADYAYFAGDGTAKYEYTNPTASKPWGRQETFISNGSVSDPGTMAVLTQAELSLGDHERTEYTRGLDFTRAQSMPFWDYAVGDYVWSAVDGTQPVKLRIRQLTLTRDEKGRVGGNVVLNDRFLEADVRAKRRIDGITNGASSGPGGGGGGEPPGMDTTPPAQVTGLAGTSAAYLGPGGFTQAQVTLVWQPPSTNADGTPLEDLDHYEIFQRPQTSTLADLRQVATTTDASIDMSPYVAGSSWRFSVRAVDTSGNRGAVSTEVAVGMARDTTGPQAPSAPVVTTRLGVVSIAWDGNPSTGSWPPDFRYVEVHTSTVNNFTPSDATLFDTLHGEGVSVVTGGAYGVPLFAKLIAVDTSGLKSVASAQGSATPARLVGTDVDPGAITYEQIGFKDPGNVIPDGSFESVGYRSNLLFRSSPAWTFTTADHYHGDYAATVNAATNASTSRQLVLMSPAEVQQITATSKLFCRLAYKITPGATGALQLVAEWTLQAGGVQTSVLTAPSKVGTWQQAAAQLTAPAGVESFRIYLELTSAATSGVFSVDAVEVRRTVGTEIIEDAAIGNAQIDVLAVNSAQIMSLDVGKLTAGQLNADVLVAGRLTTASSGNRLEMSGTGLRMYRGSTLTGWWNPTLGQMRIYASTDASATSTGHGLQFGDDDSYNLIIDENEIMARFNGTYSTLHLNFQGGDVLVGSSMVVTDNGIRTSWATSFQPMRPRDLISYSDLTVTSTTPVYDSPNLGIAFVGPASGRVLIGVGATARGDTAGTCYVGPDVRNGATGSGTTFLAWDSANAFGVRGVDLLNGMMWTLVESLTPGADYTARCLSMVTGGTGYIYSRKIMVIPQM